MLGLQRGTVEIVAHNSEWKRLFAEEKDRIQAVLRDKALDIQHIGSTSVPGLVAKPLLDIAVAVPDVPTVTDCVPLLESIAYTYFGDRYGKGDYFFAKGAPGDAQERTHYIHMAEHSGLEWTTMLRFRDYLIASPLARERYAALKQELRQQHARDLQAYTNGKAWLIKRLLEEAAGITDKENAPLE